MHINAGNKCQHLFISENRSMKILRIALAVILYLNIVGCATTKVAGPTMKQVCEGYIGKHYSEVVEQWGNYNGEKDDGQGGKILTWVDIIQPTHYTNFNVNSEGIIYKWESTKQTKTDIEIEKNRNNQLANTVLITAGLLLLGFFIWAMNNMEF
jgi:hypothetical protein